MKITILQTGQVPAALRDRFDTYPVMFQQMFAEAGAQFSFETVKVLDNQSLPDPDEVDGVVITGSAAGVYDDYIWLDPLRDFIRRAYAQKTPMAGICFGHQVIADALGGVVRKSEKGWGLGRHVYDVKTEKGPFAPRGDTLAVACSHQDQVIEAPRDAQVILGSDFTPNAGLFYNNGAALSFQPHPEFKDAYALELAHLRRGIATDDVVDRAVNSFALSSDSRQLAEVLGKFFVGAKR